MKYIFFILLFAITNSSFGQSVKGLVKDSITKESIPYATIRIYSLSDSIYRTGGISSPEGNFKLAIPSGKYKLEVSSIGYNIYEKKISVSDKDILINNILMSKQEFKLDEAVVYAPVPNIVVKGDTIEYNADAYKVDENALLQDLISRIPGIEISPEGKLMANGKIITKILVDGKEFFGNDIDLALKNLPASMVNKLQLFKQESDMSKITGFKDNNSEQVLNLTVKEGLKQSVFGNAQVGYGSNRRYSNRINAHYMEDNNQISFIANMNNITDDFEYSGVSGQYDGITKNKKIGLNISADNSEKLSVGGNIRYENTGNLFQVNSNTQTFINSGNRFSEQYSSSNSIKRDLVADLNLKWKPDSLTTLYARINTTIGDDKDIKNGTSKSYIQNAQDTTRGRSNFTTNGDTYGLNGSLVFGRRLNSKGRTVSLTLNGTLRKSDSDGTNYSIINYGTSSKSKILDQLLDIKNNGRSWGITASYVEPITKKSSIQFSYNIRKDYTNNNRITYVKDPEGEYSIVDTAYTRKNVIEYTTQRLNVGYQHLSEKLQYTIGLNIDPTKSSNHTNMRDSVIEDQSQSVVNFSPTFKLTYNPKPNITFDIDYYGTTSQPTLRQLSSDTIIVDALNTTYGNPELKPSYENNLNMYFQTSNYEKGSFFMISMGANYILNKIVDYTLIDNEGNAQSSYRSINGNWGLNGGMMFNYPLNKYITIDNSSFVYLTRNIGYSNGIKNNTKNVAINETFSLSYKHKAINQRLQLNLAANLTRTNLPTTAGLNTANYGIKSSTILKLPYDINIINDISYTYNYGYSADFKNTELLWNATISKQFLKKKAGTIKIQCYDILNDRNNIVRAVTGNYVSDTRTNMIGQYVLISFSYRFNVFKSGGDTVNKELDNTVIYQ